MKINKKYIVLNIYEFKKFTFFLNLNKNQFLFKLFIF